jgi:hypothetical protein
MRIGISVFVVTAGLLPVPGCGKGPALAPVKGKVTCNGKGVPDAAVIFSPMPKAEGAKESGKAAQGGTDAAGEFTLSTYKTGDGALVGRHRASVILDNANPLPCKGRAVEVEVKPGKNDFTIELNQ